MHGAIDPRPTRQTPKGMTPMYDDLGGQVAGILGCLLVIVVLVVAVVVGLVLLAIWMW